MDVPGTVKNIFINWFADVQHWEVRRGSRLATLGHVKLPRSQAMRCRVAHIPSERCRLGGSKHHQLQIASSTKKRLISPKFNYISAFLTKFNYKRLQSRSMAWRFHKLARAASRRAGRWWMSVKLIRVIRNNLAGGSFQYRALMTTSGSSSIVSARRSMITTMRPRSGVPKSGTSRNA